MLAVGHKTRLNVTDRSQPEKDKMLFVLVNGKTMKGYSGGTNVEHVESS